MPAFVPGPVTVDLATGTLCAAMARLAVVPGPPGPPPASEAP